MGLLSDWGRGWGRGHPDTARVPESSMPLLGRDDTHSGRGPLRSDVRDRAGDQEMNPLDFKALIRSVRPVEGTCWMY